MWSFMCAVKRKINGRIDVMWKKKPKQMKSHTTNGTYSIITVFQITEPGGQDVY